MPDRAKKKEQKRLKRKHKQLAQKKAAAVSPFAQFAAPGGDIQFWWNPTFPDSHLAEIVALRTASNGRHAVAVFLIDLGVLGIKDAFGRLDITPSEFHERFFKPTDKQIGLAQVSAEDARSLIAGGMRFAHDNGFRLPADLDRWLKIIGGVGDWRTADTSRFIMECVGGIDELKARLIGQRPDEFLARKDVAFILRDNRSESFNGSFDDDEFEDDEESDESSDARQDVREAVAEIADWIESQGRQVERSLPVAYAFFIGSLAATLALGGESSSTPARNFTADMISKTREYLQGKFQMMDPEMATSMAAGFGQLYDFLKSQPSSMDPDVVELANPDSYVLPLPSTVEALAVTASDAISAAP